MNILIATDYASPYPGNFMESIKKLEEKVIENGGKIVYTFPEKCKQIEWIVEFVKTREVYFHSKNIVKNISEFKDIIKKYNVNILYSHFCIQHTQIALKVISSINKKVKLVVHYHNHYEISGNLIKKCISKYSLNGDLNIACSASVAKSIPYKNVVTVENCINFSRLDKYEDIKIAGDNQIVILMFGFDYKRKGVDIAIRALKDIAEKYDIILAISVSVRLEELKQNIINDFGSIPGFVKFLEPRNDIATYYRASDIFLTPSREEGFCYANIEAIYCKTMCIASDYMVDIYNTLISNSKKRSVSVPGIISFKNEDEKDLKKKVVKLIEEKSYNDLKIKDESKKLVTESCKIENWVNKTYKELESMSKG